MTAMAGGPLLQIAEVQIIRSFRQTIGHRTVSKPLAPKVAAP